MTRYAVTPTGAGSAIRPDEIAGLSRWGDEFVFAKGVYAPFRAAQNGAVYRGEGAIIDGDKNPNKVPGIHVTGQHVTVEGFEVRDTKGPGIGVYSAHYAKVLDNDVHDGTGHGIYANRSGKLLIEGNHVENIAGPRPIAGISVHQPVDVGWDGSPGTQVVGNHVENVAQTGAGRHTDGNGIIIDNNPKVASEQTVVVSGNTVEHVGSDGVLFFNVEHFEFSNNTIRDYGEDRAMNAAGQGAVEFRDSYGHAWGNDMESIDGHPLAVWRGHNVVHWDEPDGVQAAALHFNDWIL